MEFQTNDPRLGKLAADGVIERWPATDLFGGRFREEDRPNFTRRAVTGTPFFVVVRPGDEHDGIALAIAPVDTSIFTEPPDGQQISKRAKG